MRFFNVLAAGAALVAGTLAQERVTFNSYPNPATIGQEDEIAWRGGVPEEVRKGKRKEANMIDALCFFYAITNLFSLS